MHKATRVSPCSCKGIHKSWAGHEPMHVASQGLAPRELTKRRTSAASAATIVSEHFRGGAVWFFPNELDAVFDIMLEGSESVLSYLAKKTVRPHLTGA